MKTCKEGIEVLLHALFNISFTEQDDGWTIQLAWMLEIRKTSQPGSKPQTIQLIA
jgi:hypothetical protein